MLVCIRDEWEGWEDHGVLVRMTSDNGYRLVDDSVILKWYRDLKQTTTETATRTLKNKRSNWQSNSSARAF